jgi:sulfatase-like protein
LQDSKQRRIPNKYAAEVSWQRYMLQVGYADRLIGQLIDRLKQEGIWDKAVVVVTADHGMAFVHGQPPRTATSGNVGQIAGVPMFVKAPGRRRGQISPRHVCTTDVLPMIARLLGTKVPWRTDACIAEPGARDEVAIRTGDKVTLTVPFPKYDAARAQTNADEAALFGAGPPDAVYDLGQLGGLIGSDVSALPAAPGSAARFKAQNAEVFNSVDPASGSVPALLQGTISGPIGDGTPLAIAVNGKIAAISRAFAPTRSARVLAMIPPGAFVAGRNNVEVLAISGTGRRARLTPIGGVNTR